MHESILPSPDFEQDDAFDTALREVLEAIESGDEMLVKLVETLGIQFDYDGSALTAEQRQALSKKCLAMLGFEPDDAFDTLPCEFRDEVKESSEEITPAEAHALAIELDYDGSRLPRKQRQDIFMTTFAMHLKDFGLRSPQYYDDKSQSLSVAEAAWPGAVGYLKAEKLKQGYIEPEDLIERLRKLKPSDNFELRKFRHPRMSWKSPTPLEEEGFEILPPDPDWLFDQLYAVTHIGKRLGRQLTDQYRREIKDRWAAVESSVELMPLPDLHLLRDMGRSPGGTLLPWYLVKGLMALRDRANKIGDKSYREEYDSAIAKREEAMNRWRERYPDSILADHALSIYRTWPADLMAELDEIDRQAIRCGRRKYVALLKETEEKMRALLAFWRGCGLVIGQRNPPFSWWQDPKAKVKRLPKSQYLKERLDAIKTEFGYSTDTGEKLRMIETSRWIEAIINGDSESTTSDTPLPPSLLDELDIVWRDRHWLDQDDTEDEMIARIRRWRESTHQQRLEEGLRTSPQLGSDVGPEEPVQNARFPVCSGPKKFSRDSGSGSVMGPEDTCQLPERLCREARRQPRTKITKAEDQAIWQGRLRSITKTKGQTSWRDRTKATNTQTGKPIGIVKRRKASKKKRSAATKGQVTTFTTTEADPPHLSSTQPHFNESSPQAIPGSVTKNRGTNLRRQSPRQASAAQPQGVRKTRNDNRRQTRRLMGAGRTTRFKQGLHHNQATYV